MPQPQKIKMYYDPRGQVVHSVNPDGTKQRFFWVCKEFFELRFYYTAKNTNGLISLVLLRHYIYEINKE